MMLHEIKDILRFFRQNEDVAVTLQDKNLKKEEIVATTNFKNKYIKKRRRKFHKLPENTLRVWDWTNNMFREIPTKQIIDLEPLSKILNNE